MLRSYDDPDSTTIGMPDDVAGLDAEAVEECDAPVRVLVHRPGGVRLRGHAESGEIGNDELPAPLQAVKDRVPKVCRQSPAVKQQHRGSGSVHRGDRARMLTRGVTHA